MGSQFWIKDDDLLGLKDKTVVLTGGASGMGLATAKLLLDLGANVVAGDVNESALDHPNHTFVKIDVTSWSDLLALFQTAKQKHSRIDHVFANAGIGGMADYFQDSFDSAGTLLEPSTKTYDVNQRGMINTAYLGLHHFRAQDPPGGSIVCTASASSFQPFMMADYATTKHAIFGFMRGIVANIGLKPAAQNFRINCIGPSWTMTGLVPPAVSEAAGVVVQSAEVVARNVVYLFADESRNGEFVYSQAGEYYEIEKSRLLPLAREVVGKVVDENEGLRRVMQVVGGEVDADGKARGTAKGIS